MNLILYHFNVAKYISKRRVNNSAYITSPVINHDNGSHSKKIGRPSKSFGNNVSIDAEESVHISGKKCSLHSIHIPAVARNKNIADKKSRCSSRLNHWIVVFSLENFKGGKLPLN